MIDHSKTGRVESKLEEVGGKIKNISVAAEFAQAISTVYHEEPVSTLVGGDFAL